MKSMNLLTLASNELGMAKASMVAMSADACSSFGIVKITFRKSRHRRVNTIFPGSDFTSFSSMFESSILTVRATA